MRARAFSGCQESGFQNPWALHTARKDREAGAEFKAPGGETSEGLSPGPYARPACPEGGEESLSPGDLVDSYEGATPISDRGGGVGTEKQHVSV